MIGGAKRDRPLFFVESSMEIFCLPAFQTNYIFVLRHNGETAVVDPGEAAPVLALLQEKNWSLTAIFNTHHHNDHIGGNRELLRHFPEARVYASRQDHGRIPGQTHQLQGGDRLALGDRQGEIFFIPGHTYGHIAYYFPDRQGPGGDLFCGDTLFSAGCGRLFEGTPEQMRQSLDQLRQLPPETRVWCAHEYTLDNLQFALTVEGNNPALQERHRQVKAMREAGQASIPSTLATETATNPFLRWDQPAIQQAMGSGDPAIVFRRLRGKKDLF